MAKSRFVTALLIIVFLLAGCGDRDVEKFVGTWHRPQFPDQTISIKNEGGGKISVTSSSTTNIGHVSGDTAVFGALGTASFKADGTLVYAGWEYARGIGSPRVDRMSTKGGTSPFAEK